MFDVTPEDIAQLSDKALRELVGRLCEAEAAARGLPPLAVTWGGHQNATDGGLDVRVELGDSADSGQNIPRPTTGFQVKVPDMPRAKILEEMCPQGGLRPAIEELARAGGAYIIVSSSGSVADGPLRARRKAMRDAMLGNAHADQLAVDFYDRTRLATWVRQHPGLVVWVRQQVGRSLEGWQPYAAWSGPAEGLDATYLTDETLRIHLGLHNTDPSQPVSVAIDYLRAFLAKPQSVVRLVGLSGVGKTRLIQALFDERIGSNALPKDHAVYTDLNHNPTPQPTSLASDLIAQRRHTVLVVDNCGPELHRELATVCTLAESQLSVITIEYDVREDLPEHTQVVTLETSSPQLIEGLIRRRYSHISQVDARTIADACGGNARIAIALAQTVDVDESISGLTDEALFDRLFRQRHAADGSLLRAAQACSLLYSFEGELLDGDEAELPRLAALARQSPEDLFSHVQELYRRDLVQRRHVWRAVLPHAIANRLAVRALEDLPPNSIARQLVDNAPERVVRSFSRRLSFLHAHQSAVRIAERWLSAGGRLGDVAAFTMIERQMLENVAPVAPESTLTALERVAVATPDTALETWSRHVLLLRSLAYEPVLFDRCMALLLRIALEHPIDGEAKQAERIIVSFCQIALSGTHAPVEKRFTIIEQLLGSEQGRARTLGQAALAAALKTSMLSSSYSFAFGARSRDHGYYPATQEELAHWYRLGLGILRRLALGSGAAMKVCRALLAQHLRGLWRIEQISDELATLILSVAGGSFWRDGWVACRETLRYESKHLSAESVQRLRTLEAGLAPSNVADRVRAVVLTGGLRRLDDKDDDEDYGAYDARLNVAAFELAVAAAGDSATLTAVLPELLREGNRVEHFGRGLASAAGSYLDVWSVLVQQWELLASDDRNPALLRGYMAEIAQHDNALAQDLLEQCLARPSLAAVLPALQFAVGFDERGIARLRSAFDAGDVALFQYHYLADVFANNPAAGTTLSHVLPQIAARPEGFHVAIEVLMMWILRVTAANAVDPAILAAGRAVLQHVPFGRGHDQLDYEVARVAEACLSGALGESVGVDLAIRARGAVQRYETNAWDQYELL